MGVVANLVVRVSADVSAFDKQFASLQKTLSKQGAKLQSIGGDLTRSVTLPLAAIAVGSVKMAMDFETAMTKVQTLASESEGNIKLLRQAVLDLAPSVGIGPTQLADALLVIESTGFRGAEAMRILEMSAKASAIGLGDAKDVARAVTAAVNAYGKENLTAAQATDMLTATVDAGGAEADELAGELGRVVGVAAQLGVSFDQVGAFIATYTKLGLSAAEATTGLSGALNMILNPSREAREALAGIGLSAESLRRSVAEKGLGETLITLLNSVKGNGDAVGALFGNVRALAGVLGTAGSQATTYRQILDQIRNSTDTLNERFAIWRTTTAATWKEFTAQIQVAAIQLGQQLAPAFSKVLQAASPVLDVIVSMIQGFSKLPQPVQTTAISLLAVAAAAGPVTYVVGSLMKAGAGLLAVFRLLGGAAVLGVLKTIIAGVSSFGLALAGLVTVGLVALNEVRKAFEGLWATLRDGKSLWEFFTAKDDDNFVRRMLGLSETAIAPARLISPAGAEFGENEEALRRLRAEVDARAAAAAVVEQQSKAIRQLRNDMLGLSDITAATDLLSALGLTDISTMGPAKQAHAYETLAAGIEALQRAGKPVPATMQAMADALFRAGVAAGELGSVIDISGLDQMAADQWRDVNDAMAEWTENATRLAALDTSPIDLSGLAAEQTRAEEAAAALGDLDDVMGRIQDKDIAAQAQQFERLGSALGVLGSSVGGAAGSIIGGLGGIVDAFARFQKGGGPTGAMASMTGLIEGAAMVMQATGGSLSQSQAMFQGAMAGASAGLNPALMAATGGWSVVAGAGAGALAGFFRNGEDEAAQAGHEAAELFRDALVEGFQQQGDFADRLAAGNSRSLQVAFAIRDVYGEIGISARQATLDIARLNQAEQQGPDQVARVLADINAHFERHTRMMEDWAEGVARFTDGFSTRISGFAQMMDGLTVATDDTSASFDRMGQFAVIAFSSTLQQTQSVMAAFEAIHDPLQQLIEMQQRFGLEGSAAFTRLTEIDAIILANQDVFTSIEGLNQMMAGLQQATLLTQADMQLFGLDAVSLFNELTARGVDANLSMALMQPTLQTLWEHQQQFGAFTDEATTALLREAEAGGLVGAGMRDVMQQVLGVLTQIADLLETRLPAAFLAAASAAEHLQRAMPEGAVPTGTSAVPRPDAAPISFANEGIVRRPTLAMIGDAPGGEPELVLRESTVKRLAGGTGGLTVNVTVNAPGGDPAAVRKAAALGVADAIEQGGPVASRWRRVLATVTQ